MGSAYKIIVTVESYCVVSKKPESYLLIEQKSSWRLLWILFSLEDVQTELSCIPNYIVFSKQSAQRKMCNVVQGKKDIVFSRVLENAKNEG